VKKRLLSLLLAFALACSLGLASTPVAPAATATDTSTASSTGLKPNTDYSPGYRQYLQDVKNGNAAKYNGAIPRPFAPAAPVAALTSRLRTEAPAAPAVWNPLTQTGTTSNYLPAIKNQGSTGACWAFGAVGLVDIYDTFVNKTPNNYSEEHLRFAYSNKNPAPVDATYDRSPDDGGNFDLAATYMTNWTGMVLDSAAPFSGTVGESWPAAKMSAPVVDHVTGTEALPMNAANLKATIMQYGAVNVVVDGAELEKGPNLNTTTNAAYGASVNGNALHSVLLVGWDDTYAVSNFNSGSLPKSPGAWLLRNSWGTGYGNSGYFWLSYQDAMLSSPDYNPACYAVTQDRATKSTETIVSDDHMPQWGQITMSGAKQLYAANTYQMKACATVSDVMLYSASTGAKYSVYIVPAAANGTPSVTPSALSSPLASGTVTHEGYQTASLSTPYLVPVTGKYSVVIAYNVSGASLPGLTTEFGESGWGTAYINPGESSYSSGGAWSDLYTFDKTYSTSSITYGNFCIRAIMQAPVPTAPTIVSAATASIVTGTGGTFQVATRGTDTIVRSLTGAPAGVSINSSTGLITVASTVAMGTYTFTIGASNGVSPNASQSFTLKVIPATPKLASLANSTTGPLLKWGKASGASGYYIYRKTSTTSWAKIATISSASTLSYVDKTAVSGTAYKYTVRAYGGSGPLLSGYDSNGLIVTYVATPKLVSAVNVPTGVKVTWAKVSGATGYLVYRKTGTGGWVKGWTVTSSSTVTLTNVAVTSGTTYTYTVRAYKTSTANLSSYNATGLKRVYVATPKLVSLVNSKSGPVLKWSKVSAATGYIVYRKTGTGGWAKLWTATSGATVVHTNASAVSGKTYTYTVRAYKGSTSVLSSYNATGLKITVKK